MRTYVLLVPLVALAVVLPGRTLDAKSADWHKRLSVNDADDLYKAIVRAAELKDAQAALALLQTGTRVRNPHIAIACGEALAGMEAEALDEHLFSDRKFKKWWSRIGKDKDERVQQNLARILGTWGHRFVDKQLGQLCAGRRAPEVQAEALFMAGSLDKDQLSAFPEVKKSVEAALKKGRNDEILCAACSAAGRLHMKSSREQLLSLIKRARGDHAGLFAVWALKQIGWQGGISSFIYVLGKNPKKTVMRANLKAVTELATIKDVEDLLGLSRHHKKDYRDAALLALGRLPWRLTRKKINEQRAAEKAANVTPNQEPEPAKPKGGKLPDPELDIPAKVIQRMITVVREDDDWECRDAARQALLRFGEKARKQVDADMPPLVDANDFDTAITAMELCGLFGSKEAYKPLLKVAMYDKERVRRMFAARALEGVDPARAVKEVAASIEPRQRPKNRELWAVRALGYIRHMDSLEALLRIVADERFSEPILREAEFAMERLTAHRFGRKPDRWRMWLETAENPLHPRVTKFDREANRRNATEKKLYGLTGQTEKAVEDGLRWLELQQHPMGIWDGNEKGFGGVVNCEPAYTGLSLLAFVGAGYHSAEGKYRETIRRAAEFLGATQYYDGGYPVTGGGDDSWIYAYLIGMAVWGVNETYGLSSDELLAEPAQWGIDYLVRVQTPGAGWRYGPRYYQSDTSCTSWVLMTTKMADLIGLDVAQRSWDGIDDWLERCSYDITGEEEIPKDLATDYDYEVGSRRFYKAFTGYLELSGAEKSALQQVSMTAVGMVCRFFMGWKRSHPYMIGCANFLMDYLPQWMAGLEKNMAVAWYHYYWYYGTLAMHQMGGRYWRAWNAKIRKMYPKRQRKSPPELAGSWDPDTAVLNGGRLFSTAMSILTLETYYRFSPLMGKSGDEKDEAKDDKAPDKEKKGDK